MNSLGQQILALPIDWWKDFAACHTFARLFARHLLGLQLVFKHQGKVHQDVYTGFALHYRKRLLWVTAGHVIDEISERLSDPDYEIGGAAWLDGCEIPGAEAIPAGDLRGVIRYSATRDGFDFGVASLDLPAMTLLETGNLEFLTEAVWQNHNHAKPEGYYVVGFPSQWWKTSTKHISPRETFAHVRATIACLPIERIAPEEPVCKGDFWDHPSAFYAKLVGTTNIDGHPLPHLRGTSGGPIFSIERMDDGRMKYRLFGVQSACSDDRPILRAESISDIVSLMSP